MTEQTRARGIALKHHFVHHVRRVVEGAALLDSEMADPIELKGLSSQLRNIADRIHSLPLLPRLLEQNRRESQQALLSERSPISGLGNPLSPPLRIQIVDNSHARGYGLYTRVHEGPPDSLHGGLVAAAFDELMGCLAMHRDRAALTVELTVQMKKLTPLYRQIEFEAAVIKSEGRKLWIEARSLDDEDDIGLAKGFFLLPGHAGYSSDTTINANWTTWSAHE